VHLPSEFTQEIDRRMEPVSYTISIPKDHPAAKELSSLMDMLATEVRIGDRSARRPGFEDGVNLMLDALRRAGYAKEVDGAVYEIEARGNATALATGMGVLGVLLQAPGFSEPAKRAEEHLHEEVSKRLDDPDRDDA